jgi:hypothetical protein
MLGVAIVLAESGGRTDAVSGVNLNGTRDYGLWQINSVHFGTAINETTALDPELATQYAYQLSHNGTNFAPWSTMSGCDPTTGKGTCAATKNIQTAFNAMTAIEPHKEFGPASNADAVGNLVVDPIASAVKTALGDFLGPVATRVGQGLLNGVLVIGGVILMLGGIALATIALKGHIPTPVSALHNAVRNQNIIRQAPK